MKYCIILTTIENNISAKELAQTLVCKKLAACVNIIDKVKSIYVWEENIVEDNECLMIIKTKYELYEKVEKCILKLHKYDVPEIIKIPIDNGSVSYLNWINKNTL